MPLGSKVAASAIGSGNSVVPLGCHAVQRLAPPVVGGHAEPRNGARLVHQLARLFFERHALHQVGRALLRRQIRIQVRGLSGVLRPQCARRAQPQQSSRHHSHSKHRHRLLAAAAPLARCTPCIRRRPTLIGNFLLCQHSQAVENRFIWAFSHGAAHPA
jgi:hypothetical protein